MLRVVKSKNAAGAKAYFDDSLGRDDGSYERDPSFTGQWRGRGAGLLGLTGPVTRRAFGRLCDNLHPGTKENLTPRSRADRTVGWDFCFSLPKGATILHALGRDGGIRDAMLDCVRQTMADVERDMQTRVRRGGTGPDRTTGNIVWAEFVHTTTRPVDGVPDPHDHVHCYVFNATHDASEGRWKAAQPSRIMWDRPYYEALFLSRMAARMHEMGYETEPRGRYWEVRGMPESLIEKFSNRTEEIEAIAAARGIVDPRTKDGIGPSSRDRKLIHEDAESLRGTWRGRISKDEMWTLSSILEQRCCGGNLESIAPDSEVDRPRATPGVTGREASAAPLGRVAPHRPGEHRSHPEDERHSKDNRDDEAGPGTATEHVGGNEQEEWGNSGGSDCRRHKEGPGPNGPRGDEGNKSDRMRVGWGSSGVRGIVDWAIERQFGHSAVVPERALITEALNLAPGRTTESEIRAEFDRRGLIRKDERGLRVLTTPEVLREEEQMVKIAKDGRGRWRPLADVPLEDGSYGLSGNQLKVANHVLRSRDLVTLVDGPSGTDQASVLKAVRKELWNSGGPLASVFPDRLVEVFPSAEKARAADESDPSVKHRTVAAFLAEANQKSFGRRTVERGMPDRVVWMHDGSAAGTPMMTDVMRGCQSVGWRLVVTHDPTQPRSVTRGNCLPVLQENAGLRSARIEEIKRQKGEYKKAVESLSSGKHEEGFNRLWDMGAVRQADADQVAKLAARDYVESTRSGNKTLLVTPTNREKAVLTDEVRTQLKEEGRLGKERSLTRLERAEGDAADRAHAEFYHRGQTVQFHQNTRGFKAGSRWTVLGVAAGVVAVQSDTTLMKELHAKRPTFDVSLGVLPLGKSHCFEVYEKKQIDVAVGDMVRITRSGKTFSAYEAAALEAVGSHRPPSRDLNSGSVCRVKRLTKSGGFQLENDLIVAKGFGHFEHAYCSTTFGASAVDRVVLAQTRESGGAACAEQFFTSVASGKQSVMVYTDSAQNLREQMERSAVRLSAMDLTKDTGKNEAHGDATDRARAEKIRMEHARDDDRRRAEQNKADEKKDKGFDRERT